MDERLGVLVSTATLNCAPLDLWLSRAHLHLGILLVVAAQGVHRRAGEEFADVAQEALAIIMTPVGPERDRGVAQVAQVTNRLAISLPAKFGLLQDGFFEFGVRDLAVGHRLRDTEHAEESNCKENSCRFHHWSDL